MFVLSSCWRLRRFRAFASTFNAIRRSSFLQSNAIYALSSGFGKCGVSVIRVSGRQTRDALLALSKRKRLPIERKAVVMDLFHPVSNQQLDRGLILWFKGETNLSKKVFKYSNLWSRFVGPSSFTGEDVCELHVHGGTAVVAAVLDALSHVPGLRPAEPGEFTKRYSCDVTSYFFTLLVLFFCSGRSRTTNWIWRKLKVWQTWSTPKRKHRDAKLCSRCKDRSANSTPTGETNWKK